jgi:HEAT repeat protein
MGTLKGELLVGVIDSIGWRRDANAAGELTKLLNDKDPEVAGAAAAALGRVGGPHAAVALEKKLRKSKGPTLEAVADACLVCAEGLAAQGHREEAQSLYAALQRPEVPKPARIAATNS